MDCGSGTGIFADEIAPTVETVYAVDIDPEMHAYYREKGVPASVQPMTSDLEGLPFKTGGLDGALSIRSFHHGVADALEEIARVLCLGGRFVVADWSRTAAGVFDHDPNPEDHYDLSTAQSMLLDCGFRIKHAEQRWETFLIVADRQ
jgi:ubiquinone/menaquinone biosynthesis C-methylase UbiE